MEQFKTYAIIQFEESADDEVKKWVVSKINDKKLDGGCEFLTKLTKNFEGKVNFWFSIRKLDFIYENSSNIRKYFYILVQPMIGNIFFKHYKEMVKRIFFYLKFDERC